MKHSVSQRIKQLHIENWWILLFLLVAMTEPRVALLVRVPASLKSRLAEIAKQERGLVSKLNYCSKDVLSLEP